MSNPYDAGTSGHGERPPPGLASTRRQVPPLDDAAPSAGPAPGGFPPGVAAVLVHRRGPFSGTVLPVTGERTRIGRFADCEVVLENTTVSRHHATISRRGDDFVLTDAGSLNGTYRNRELVDEAVLVDGDELWIGVFRLTFHVTPASLQAGERD